MKRFTITESERNNILRKHGILLKELAYLCHGRLFLVKNLSHGNY